MPTINPEIRDCTAVSCGLEHTVILDRDGMVRVVGNTKSFFLHGGDKSRRMTVQTLTGVPRIRSVHAGYARTVLVSETGELYEFGVCRDLFKAADFPANNEAFRCTKSDPPTLVVHPARVGMHVYPLPQERALAFAFLSHSRCGVVSLCHDLPAEVVRKIIDAASTPGRDGDPRRLRRMYHSENCFH